MIFGADKQNKNLRSASTVKPNSNLKTRTANHYSAAISSSKTSGSSGSIVHQSRKNLNNNQPDPVRGSFEGLQNGKSAYVQLNNSGYDNSKFHTARYSMKNPNIPNVKGASFGFTNMQKKGIIDNYSGTTMRGTSSDRMKNSLNINRMF